MAKKITVDGVVKWVTVPVVDEEDMPLKVFPVTSVFDEPVTIPQNGYSYYGVWEDED
jgi:hypothetical protein